MTFFTKVQDVFEITVAVLVLVLPKDWGTDLRIRIGDKIQLRTPDGSIFTTRVYGVELVKKVNDHCVAGIMLPGEISRSDIPKQTEIWLGEAS